jgi:hypothetical protein
LISTHQNDPKTLKKLILSKKTFKFLANEVLAAITNMIEV